MIKEHEERQLFNLEKGLPPQINAGLFGADISFESAQIILIEVPFEATTSYGGGTSKAPSALVPASHQLDLFDPHCGEAYKVGIHLQTCDPELHQWNKTGKEAAAKVIKVLETTGNTAESELEIVNSISKKVDLYVEEKAREALAKRKIPAVLGGDHSCPLGLLRALNSEYQDFGILHIDAHHDLRRAYEGFHYSHASIMYNVLKECSNVSKIVQIGIRDFSKEEFTRAEHDERIVSVYDESLARARFRGEGLYKSLVDALQCLPNRVYISFDIDGLEPSLCPGTGTPVPGGLRFEEAEQLLLLLEELGKKVIGFDLCEVSPGEGEWDANVGARILYKLCGITACTQSLEHLVDEGGAQL